MNETRPQRFIILLCLFLVQQGGQGHTTEPKVRTGPAVSRLYRQQLTHMLNILDEDADPCEDFFAHACGYYNEVLSDVQQLSADSADEPMTVPPYLYNHEDRMLFFERNKENFGTPPGQLLATLYSSCKKRETLNKLYGRGPLSQWRRMLREVPFLAENARLYKSWPLLRIEWDELLTQHAYLDWLKLAAELAAHGVTSFVRIFFAEGTIFIAPVRARQDVRCESLKSWQAQLLPFRYTGGEQAAQVIASELRAFCRVLIGELPFDPELYTDNGGRNGSYDDSAHNSFSYEKYFKYFHGSLRFSEQDVCTAHEIYTDEQRLENISALIRSTHPSVLFNFVLWQAYVKLSYEDCFLLTEEFEPLLLSEYWNWDVFNTNFSRKVALATYLYHTTRFQEQRRAVLLGEQWDRFLYAKLQRSNFNLPRLLSTYAKTDLDPANLTEIYAIDKFVEGNFYGNLVTLRRRQLRNTFFTAYIDPEDYNHPIYFLRHFLHFTILTLQRPLFHYFATMGFDLWHKSDLLYNSDGYYTSMYCLERQSLLHYEDAPIFQLLGESQVADIFRFYRAFIESLRDYDFWLEGESFAFAEDFVLEHFQLTSKRIMFYAVAQLHCGRNDEWFSILINRSFMNMPQFATAFECEAESPMNPLVKCMINHCD
ncbi:uncharacterized protein LOC105213125 [Zeugodacus cucurbitae]|uniref:uncharacterized protein LOC105213125 n=1 Tax=Zeugodacus cucurbitae TaxID=28588 RepID=UPI0023D9539E|nr:uncharacterized protein LOC105213125 [Zeugodacus cucurbitae]